MTDSKRRRVQHTVHAPSVYLLNATSLAKSNAKEQLSVDLQNFQIDIALITETWFTKKQRTEELNINGYSLFRRDRAGGRKGGGVCAYIKTDYNCTVLDFSSSTIPAIEIVWMSCSRADFTFIVAICYHPPNPSYQPSDFISQLSHDIEYCINNYKLDLMIIAGDFNALNTNFMSDSFGLTQIVDKPTHNSNIIDKIFITNTDLYTDCIVTKSLVKTKHMAVIVSDASHSKVTVNMSKKKCQVYDLRQPNIDYLRYTIGTYDWSILYDIADIDEMYSVFLDIVRTCISHCIPMKTVTIRDSDPYYITPLVKSLLVKRNKLRRRGKADEANILATKINSLISDARRHHLTALSLANSKELWNAVKACSGKSTSSSNNYPLLSDPNTINAFFAKISTDADYNANHILNLRHNLSNSSSKYLPFTEYEIERHLRKLKNTSPGYDAIPSWVFKSCSYELAGPISYIINLSLSSGITPSNWRISIITPIPKKTKPSTLEDFRPISVTPILSRLTEKLLVRKWIKPVICSSDYSDQFGFKDTGSTTCALIKLIDYIVSSLDDVKCRNVTTLLLDFSKAFDVVDHLILLRKINDLNLPSYVKNWIGSFLTGRSQKVKTNGLISNELPINRGIVQGSALGPFLYIIMVSDFKTLSSKNTLVKYADDSTYAARSDSDVPIRNEHFNAQNYSLTNKLILNECKSKLMSFFRNICGATAADSWLNTVPGVEFVHETTLLGIIIDDELSFSKHVSFILSVCSQRFYLFKLLRDQGTPILILNTIYQSLIVGRITYGISAWGGFVKEVDVQKINTVFNRAKRCGFTDIIFDFKGLLRFCDRNLFRNIVHNPSHCLFSILPEAKQCTRPSRNSSYQYSLTPPVTRTALYRKSFIPRVLYDSSPYCF